MVCLDLRVAREAASVSQTLREVDDVVQSLRSALTEAGIADKDLQTTSTGIHQRHDPQGQGPQGFAGFHTLRVGVRNLDDVSSLVDLAVSVAGDALLIDGITLSIADPEPLLRTARERAFADARSRAQEYASFAGRALGDIIWIGDAVAAPEPRMYAMRASAESAGGLSLAPGESTVKATVSVRFAWADDDHADDEHADDEHGSGS